MARGSSWAGPGSPPRPALRLSPGSGLLLATRHPAPRTLLAARGGSDSAERQRPPPEDEVRVVTPEVFAGLDVLAGFTTRALGDLSCSSPALHDVADPSHAEVLRSIGAPVGTQWAVPRLVHGTDVCVVDAPGLYEGFDGLVTTERGILLGSTAADCATVLMVEPVAGVVATCHAGWRGAAAGVVGATVDRMREQGADPGEIRAFVSPCISVDEFEVGEEAWSAFPEEFVVRRAGWDKPHVDLKRFLEAGLADLGVLEVEVHPGCTVGEPEAYFSHRGESGGPGGAAAVGRMIGFVGLVAPG